MMINLFERIQTRTVAGYLLGLAQPSTVVQILPSSEAAQVGGLSQRLRSLLAPHLPPPRPEVCAAVEEGDDWLRLAFEISVAVAIGEEAAGIPVTCMARV
jgi:hypothetical protein